MELSKAFTTLNHDILLDKLSYYGVEATALQWFDSYLSNRSMYVEIDNMKSSVRTLTTGVPQGSILGPLLFLIYMNDISNSSNLFKFILFADDTNLFSTIEYTLPTHTSTVNELLNNKLANIYEWLTVNRLSLNLTKTKYMVFHPIQKYISSLVPTVIINGIQIEKVNNFNFLGVRLVSNLKWDGHIKLLASKLGKYSGILNKLKRYIPIDILRILYCSMVNSHLNYAILGWGFACSRLTKMQKRIIRIITCSKYNAHTSPLFKSLRILTLDDMLRLNTLKFYYKYLHNELPPYFYSFNIREQGDRHTYDTRNSGQLQVEMTRTEYADKRLRTYLPTLVNDTPTDILSMITTHCLQDFTKKGITLLNRTVRNCMLHPWLLYLSAHLKPILFSEVSITSNEYTWIWICHHMCIWTCKSARIYANVFIYTENILTKFYSHHYHHCIYCTIVHFMFACLHLFCYFHFCFCSLFSFIIIIFFITQRFCYVVLCYVCHFFIVTRHWLIVK